ncbi:MAG TPA: ThiF family adenylyltransferase [Bacteroidales bacterium]|nr:ThiF family adenylyltransferase [Bacteroidales bacterium]
MKNIELDQQEKKEWGKEVFPLLSWFKSDKVKNARVMVVGAGALGNEVLKNLALFGVGNIMIIDFDTIEYSNLTRSILFRESDADKGLFKAEVAAKRLKEINPTINIQYIIGRLATDVGLAIYRRMDVIIGCLDGNFARLQLNRMCMRAGKPWIDGGIFDLSGTAKVFSPGRNCFECELTESAKKVIFDTFPCGGYARRNEKEGRVATTPVIASIIGAIQVQEAMKLIHHEELETGAFESLCGSWFSYDGLFLNAKRYKSEIFDDTCAAHETWEPVVRIDGLSADTTIADALEMIKEKLNVKKAVINLRNDKFVDKIVTRTDNKRYFPKLPESKIPDYIESVPAIFNCLQRDVEQNEIENIDNKFHYVEMTLKEIGIPHNDIIQVTTEDGYVYVELYADAKMHVLNI